MKTVNNIDPVIVVCYGEEEFWGNRTDAEAFYLEGMSACAGAERDRYTNIYLKLKAGLQVCTDQDDDE